MQPLALRCLLAAAPIFTGAAATLSSPQALADLADHRLPQLSPAQPGALVGACEDLAARLTVLSDTTITAATTVASGVVTLAGQPVPEHCRVTGQTARHTSAVDGKTYAIGFEMRLPKVWNGRYFYQGNGGIDGSVVQASGTFGGGPRTGALLQGFAVLSSDAGHDNAQGGPAFGLDPQARLDYGYQAVGKLTRLAKEAIELAYGKRPDRSYIGGCSNGGRHTLVAAARYGEDYDGFLAGAPGYRLPLAALANIWGAQRYAKVATGDPATPAGLETAFTPAERKAVADAVLARCDGLDGSDDGLIQAVDACQRKFDFLRDVPTCSGGRDGSCLTLEQKLAIGPIFEGATRADGQPFYAPFPFDSGIAGNGIPFWEFTAPLALDSGAVGTIFKVPPSTVPLTDGPGFSLTLDIDAALAELRATDEVYTESALSFMTPPDASDLSALRRRGAKVIVYHGVSDPIFSVVDTERWYRRLGRDSGGEARSFARFYRIPGMGHCSGGPATDQADFLTPLVDWVEHGRAPEAIIATARGPGNPGGVNPEIPADWGPDRTRPLCPYPGTARHQGGADVNQASAWSCQVSGRRAGYGRQGHGGEPDNDLPHGDGDQERDRDSPHGR
jgi:feruloyl esterase